MIGRLLFTFGLLAASCTNVQTASDSGAGRDTGSEATTPADTPMVDVPDVPTITDAPDADVPDATAVGMDVSDSDVADADGSMDREDVSDVADAPDVPADAGPPRMTFTFVSAALVGGGDGGPQMRATISWHGMLRGENDAGVRLEAFFR